MENQESLYRQISLQFAQALVSSEFTNAYDLLSSSIRDEWSPSLLKEEYEAMVEYFEAFPNYIHVEVVDTKMPNIGKNSAWVYVSIAEGGNAEAVTVVVGEEQGRYLIKEIEWGRP